MNKINDKKKGTLRRKNKSTLVFVKTILQMYLDSCFILSNMHQKYYYEIILC